ncbi:hypothetical protein GCM10008015_30120 [Flavobacterium palustre]|uniref:MFS transporter n=1 Tax=Flavobacterium palustre TaxID=1476463 RepID=A0ABQ1HTE5_9FLAO|nr:YrzE family protein [Flavobacterium palustre]GGA87438.1 hypothetical protein GCM10008015_30120 [Flavobacterium palustre]
MENYAIKICSIIEVFEQNSKDINTVFHEISGLEESDKSSTSWLFDNIDEPDNEVPNDTNESLEVTEELTKKLSQDDKEEIVSSLSVQKDIYFQDSDTTLSNLYKLLNYSLLSGEYIYNKNLKNEIDIVENRLSDTLNYTNSFHRELQTKISEFISAIKIGCTFYKTFIKGIENEYSTDKVDYVFSFNQQIRKEYHKATLSDHSENLCKYFVNNLELSFYDHFFSSEDRQFEGLFKIEKAIEEIDLFEFDTITKVLKFKIEYLEYKWTARKQQENTAVHFSVDGNTNTIQDYSTTNPDIIYWTNIIDSHYELFSPWQHKTERRIKQFKNNEFEDLKFLQLHQLIKYYKDVNRNYSKLTEISKFLLSKKSENTDNFYDRYSLNIIKNYAVNNAFSSFLEKNNNIHTIKDEYYKAKDKTQGDINNFFLDYKYLNALIDILNKKSDEVSNIKFLDEYEELISSECRKKLDEYYLNKEWSKINNNYIFLLPFDESTINIPEFKIKELPFIFISSSFILPAVNNQIEKQYAEIRQKFKSLSFQIDAIRRIRKDLEEIKELKGEIEKRDFKSIEIISIFTAIITFVLSSIPAYKFVDSVSESILFMFGLACALGIFVMLILFATRGFIRSWVGYIYVIVLIVLATIGYNTIISDEKTEVVIKKELNESIDSLATKKIDSILLKKENFKKRK